MTSEDWAEHYQSGENPIPNHIHDWLREAWNSGKAHATPKWQPIETGPHDKPIVLWGRFWNDRDVFQRPMIGSWNEHFQRWEILAQMNFGVRPTHWMPLPEPPSEDGDDIL